MALERLHLSKAHHDTCNTAHREIRDQCVICTGRVFIALHERPTFKCEH